MALLYLQMLTDELIEYKLIYHKPFHIVSGLYRISCGVHTLGDRHSAIVNPAGQFLLTRRVNNS